jgi:hypothetical protein
MKYSNEGELITLAAACRRTGIAPQTALKLMPAGEFPEATWLGGKRVLPRRRFEAWLKRKVGEDSGND